MGPVKYKVIVFGNQPVCIFRGPFEARIYHNFFTGDVQWYPNDSEQQFNEEPMLTPCKVFIFAVTRLMSYTTS